MTPNIEYSKTFTKNFNKRILPNKSLAKRFFSRLDQFIKDPANPILKDHPLKGTQLGKRSFSINGDYRVIYMIVADSIVLYDIGTHNQVY